MTDSESSAVATNPDQPRPMPFAIMRNVHEALRASIQLQQKALDAENEIAFRDEWGTFQRALSLHMAMEDEAMFGLLDKVGTGAITMANLPEEHEEDIRLSAAVESALGMSDLTALRNAWTTWKDAHLHHLAHEEQVMMPLTMKTATTAHGRALVVHDVLVVPFESKPDFDWFIGWAVHMLSHYGSNEQPANVATRVFAWGLQHACTPDQWRRLRPIVQQNCAPEIWAELAEKFGLNGEGAIVK
jgi:hypothetical protein